jgi:menaquinone-dependent protoporphyrinogen IX oxidase
MKAKSKTQNLSQGAIFFTGKHGATRQYAHWIAEETGLPIFDLAEGTPDLKAYDFLILGSAVYIHRLAIRRWLRLHWESIRDKPLMLFTVSGSPADHPDLVAALKNSLTPEMRKTMNYVPLRGRLNLEELSWWIRLVLKIGAAIEKDEEAKYRMRNGFDEMDQSKIRPIVEWAASAERTSVSI